MRNLRILPVAVIAMVLITSCTKTDMNTISIAEAQGIIPGSYKVNSFAGTGDLAQYTDYTFEFISNGELRATKGAESYTGSWDITTIADVTYDKEVSITIAGNEQMDMLNHSWFVKDVTDVTLNLVDETAEEEFLFIKI
jgi:hypothetical protein